jgi:hypothetical protein
MFLWLVQLCLEHWSLKENAEFEIEDIRAEVETAKVRAAHCYVTQKVPSKMTSCRQNQGQVSTALITVRTTASNKTAREPRAFLVYTNVCLSYRTACGRVYGAAQEPAVNCRPRDISCLAGWTQISATNNSTKAKKAGHITHPARGVVAAIKVCDMAQRLMSAQHSTAQRAALYSVV